MCLFVKEESYLNDNKSMKNVAFVLPPKLTKKLEKIQREMGVDDPGVVIAKAIDLLDISIGRKVILEEKETKRALKINGLEEYNQTFVIDNK